MNASAEATFRWNPLTLLAVIAGSGFVVVMAAQPIRDEDIWWHELIGSEILAKRRVSGLGNAWAPFGDTAWTTTQWLSEVVYAIAYDVAGWGGIPVVRVLAAAGFALGLGLVLLRRGNPRATALVYVVTLAGTALWVSRDRPQSLALVFVVVAASWLRDSVAGRFPRWWLVAMLTLLWSQLHGSWVIAPMVFGIALVANLAERRTTAARDAFVPLAVAATAGLLNPAGIDNATAILRFSAATSHILEWGSTPLVSNFGLMLLVMLILVLVAWALSDTVPPVEVVALLAVAAFGLLAIRNVPAALVLMAPLVADRLSVVLPAAPTPSDRESRGIARVGAFVVVAALGLAVVADRRTDPLAEAGPTELVAALAELEQPVRVFNTYSLGGLIAQFGPPEVEVTIDGRADRYSPDYIADYLAAERSLVGWESMIETTAPDVLMLAETTALATHLLDRGWPLVAQDAGFVLIERPKAAA